MPELPEVEAVARALGPLVEGRKIQRCRVLHTIAVRPPSGRGEKQTAAAIQRGVRGQRICAVERRGKYLILVLERGYLVLHFRLDGRLLWLDSDKVSGHVDVMFQTPHGTLGFADRRHFGRVQLTSSLDEIPAIRSLGVEPLSKEFSPALLVRMLRASQQPLKHFLLDQEKIAGIGNIYSSEAMWRARLNPHMRANRLNQAQARRLHKAIVDVLHRAVECCLDPLPDFRDADWWFQGLEGVLRVYGREGKTCHACGSVIRRIKQGGRSTFLCAHCQR
jgi:formamidopyrimidine-DNA glycosylase